MTLYGGAASRTPLLGPDIGGHRKGYTRTITYPGGVNPYYKGSSTSRTFNRLFSSFQKKEQEARAANLKRYEQAMSIYDEIINRMKPGGAFEQAGLAEIEKQKVKGVGAETQQLIGSGLYGTTTMAGVGRRWESEVGGPARLRLEDLMQQRLTSAQSAKAGFIERREDTYPDYGMLAGLASQI